MLEGITVLNQEMIIETPGWVGLIMIVCLIGLFISVVCCLTINDDTVGIISGVLAIVFIIGLFFIEPLTSKVETGRYRYEVTIDESVSFNDIYERYEIVEQRGEIWVLEEKE